MLRVNINRSLRLALSAQRVTLFQWLIDSAFRPMVRGRLTMRLPDGRVWVYGNGEDGPVAQIQVRNQNFFRKCVFFGDVGFGESYVDGDWDTDDITQVIAWMIHNVETHPTLMADKSKRGLVNILKKVNNFLIPLRRNSLKGSRQNIQAHYDLGNDFYAFFLDATMAYSAGYFRSDTQTLEQAQYQKFEELCQKIKLNSRDHLLEIGCGWGGFAVYAAKNYGCRVTAVTISSKQYEYACNRVVKEGLQGRVTVELKDYRALTGSYDKIVSIEMLEAVGHEFYQKYFRQCHFLLKRNGLLAIQVILCPDHRYHSFRTNIDWIQKHIFPGSLLPSFAVLQRAVNSSGNLGLLDYEDMTVHYARTLRIWYENFNGKCQQIRDLGFSDAFIRKWNYYLCYCEAAFMTRNISVAQIIYSRPNNV